MKRYSNLYGTIYASGNQSVAVYASVGSSQQLPAFLNEIGATNAQLTVDTVRNILAGFPNDEVYAAHYASQPKNDLPVSVRYAPMHLRNHPSMPNTIKPFTAIGISGNENKRDEGDNRYSTYVQTLYIGREHMHEPVTEKVGGVQKTYNYLDQIFGTQLLSHTELALVRGNKIRMDYDALPGKVEPRMQLQDRTVVFNTVDAVFDNKTVVIRLEKGCAFNKRAWELLIPIYALMPPRLATEIGFATYLLPSEIQKLAADTSMRIFVLPAECDLSGLEAADTLIMDLDAPVRAVAGEEIGKILNAWNRLAWEKRLVAMERIFADTAANFNDKELFIQRSTDFFTELRSWEKEEWLEKGSIATLEELKAKFDSLPLCAQIPWAKETFAAKVPVMLRKGVTLPQLTADALAAALYGKTEEQKREAQQLYRFASDLASLDAIQAAKASGKLVRAKTLEEAAPELEAQKQATAKAIADGEAAVAQAKAEGEAARAAAVAAGAAAVAAEQAKTAQAVADGEAAVAQAKAEGEAAVAQVKAECEAAVAAEQARQEQLKQVAAEKIKAERDAHAATQQKLDDEAAAHQSTQTQLAAVSQECETVKTERDGLNQRLERAKTAFTELKKAKADADQELTQLRSESEQVQVLKREAQQAKDEATQLRTEAEQLKQGWEEKSKKQNQRSIIFAAAGFLAAALIFGVILLVVLLGGNKEPELEVTEPSETIAETTEATEATEVTEEPTEAPTEEPTEPTVPDLTDWSDDTAALWIREEVPGVEEIVLEAEDLPAEVLAVEDYTAVAVIRLGSEEDYAVLLQRIVEEAEQTDDERVLLENETKPEGEEEPTEEPTEAVPELTAVQVEGALAVLTSEEFVLVVYGSEETALTALEVYGLVVGEDAEVLTLWNLGETVLAPDGMIKTMMPVSQWWRKIEAVILSEEELTAAAMNIGTDNLPFGGFSFGEYGDVYFIPVATEVLAEDLNEILTQAGHQTAYEGTTVAVMPAAQQ